MIKEAEKTLGRLKELLITVTRGSRTTMWSYFSLIACNLHYWDVMVTKGIRVAEGCWAAYINLLMLKHLTPSFGESLCERESLRKKERKRREREREKMRERDRIERESS